MKLETLESGERALPFGERVRSGVDVDVLEDAGDGVVEADGAGLHRL